MEHLQFLWQVLGITLAFVSTVFLFYLFAVSRHKALLPLAFSILAWNARTILFTFSNYNRLSSLGSLPVLFEYLPLSGFIHVFLVALAAWLIALSVFRMKRLPYFKVASTVFFIFIGIDLAIIALNIAQTGIGQVEAFVDPYLNPYVIPFTVSKISVVASCAFFIFGKKTADSSTHMRLGFSGIMMSQFFDLAIRVDWLPAPVAMPFLLFFFYSGILFVILDINARLHIRVISDETGSMLETIKQRHKFDENEMRIFKYILQGASNKDIAYREKLSLPSVKHKIFSMYKALGISSRFELMAMASGSLSKSG